MIINRKDFYHESVHHFTNRNIHVLNYLSNYKLEPQNIMDNVNKAHKEAMHRVIKFADQKKRTE
jgi:hypothetical protein